MEKIESLLDIKVFCIIFIFELIYVHISTGFSFVSDLKFDQFATAPEIKFRRPT
jgi:hypothetical protein